MALALSTIEEKLRNVSKVLTMQEEHIAVLHEELRSHQEKACAVVQAAETVSATPSTGVPTHYSTKPCWPAPPGFEWILEEGVGMWTLGSVPQAEEWQETVPPSKAGAAPAYNIEAGERAAYLRGFESAKALLLAVKPEPERGPDNFLWVNIYPERDGTFSSSDGHKTIEAANLYAASNRCARVRVWFNEGQYDD